MKSRLDESERRNSGRLSRDLVQAAQEVHAQTYRYLTSNTFGKNSSNQTGRQQGRTSRSHVEKTRQTNMDNPGVSQSPGNQRFRPIIIDGQNVAVEHGKEVTKNWFTPKNFFSARGIEISVEYFKKRGHEEIVIWLPRHRQGNRDFKENQDILKKMGKYIKWTTARTLSSGQRFASYDDRSIVQDAAICGGIILSNDNYRDLGGFHKLRKQFWGRGVQKMAFLPIFTIITWGKGVKKAKNLLT